MVATVAICAVQFVAKDCINCYNFQMPAELKLEALDQLSRVFEKVVSFDGSTSRILPVVGLTGDATSGLYSLLPEMLRRDMKRRLSKPKLHDASRASALSRSSEQALSAEEPGGLRDPLSKTLLDAMEFCPLTHVRDDETLTLDHARDLTRLLPLRAQYAIFCAAANHAEHGSYNPSVSASALDLQTQNAMTYALPSTRGITTPVGAAHTHDSMLGLSLNTSKMAHIQPPLGSVDSLDMQTYDHQSAKPTFRLPPNTTAAEFSTVHGRKGALNSYTVLQDAESKGMLTSWMLRCFPVTQNAAAKNRSAICATWYALALLGIRAIK